MTLASKTQDPERRPGPGPRSRENTRRPGRSLAGAGTRPRPAGGEAREVGVGGVGGHGQDQRGRPDRPQVQQAPAVEGGAGELEITVSCSEGAAPIGPPGS